MTLSYSALLLPMDVRTPVLDRFHSMLIILLVYALSSVLAFDPWHMITSFVPYLLLAPSYINILNM